MYIRFYIFSYVVKVYLFKTGVKSVGKVAHVTVILPYFLLLSLLFVSFQLPGATNGILYFIKPRWGEISKVKVWVSLYESLTYRKVNFKLYLKKLLEKFGCNFDFYSFYQFNLKTIEGIII